MAKKKNSEIVKTEKEIREAEEKQRAALIKEYNQNNSTSKIIEDVIPTQDDIIQYQKEFEDAYQSLTERTYCIADKESSLRVAKFLKDWNTNKVQWRKDLWKGVIKFNEVITNIISDLENEPKDLIIDYAALSYLYMTMMEPTGIGLESAKEMESIDAEYSAILEAIGTNIDMFEQYRQYIDLLQRRWGFACQGFKLDILMNSDGCSTCTSNDNSETELIK